jgi:N,N'-diacetyllegionaminate synthase
MKTIKVGNKYIGGDNSCFIVAEAGANHEGKFENAIELIDAAKLTGSDAIKFQHYSANKLTAKEAKRYWLVHGDEKGFQFDPSTYKDDQQSTFAKIDGIPRGKDAELTRYGKEKNVIVFSTPFDFESVDHLEGLGVSMYKIASGDLTYHQLLEYVAQKGKPIVLATGAANMDEIRDAVEVIKKAGNDQIILLHCTLAYPTPLANANLLMMQHLKEEFPECLIGLSDHTPGDDADVAAAMMGAVMIEKHFTHTPGHAAGDNKVGDSPDHDIGIGKTAFTQMVSRIRANEKEKKCVRMNMSWDETIQAINTSEHPEVLGKATQKLVDENVELKARAQARRSVVTEVSLAKGTTITREMIKNNFSIKRPGTGVAPYEIDSLEGKQLNQDLEPDTVLKHSHFA